MHHRCEDCRLMLQGFAKENPTWLSNLSAQFNAVLVLDDFILEFGVRVSHAVLTCLPDKLETPAST
jgi:hypothetical protein